MSLVLMCETGVFAEPQKVLGYFPCWAGQSELEKVEFDKLTHLNYAFVQSTSEGAVMFTGWLGDDAEESSLLNAAITKARSHGLTIMICVNGDKSSGSHAILQDGKDALRNTFAGNIVNFVKERGLDGIDLDIEDLFDVEYSKDGGHPHGDYYNVRMNYGKLAKEIRRLLDEEQGKSGRKYFLSAAVGWTADADREWFSDDFVNAMDWLNPMVYDAEGWESFVHHAPYSFFVQSGTTEWPTRLPKEKIVLGVPFYGYNHASASAPNDSQVAYSEILRRYPDQQASDTLATNNASEFILYDGPDLIRKKAQFVKDEGLGGIMIWELSEDVHDERSLLRAINTVIKPTAAVHAPLSHASAHAGLRVAVQGRVMAVDVDRTDTYCLRLFDVRGRLLRTLFSGYLAEGSLHLPFPADIVGAGVYLLRVDTGLTSHTAKLSIE
jgi:GH18 family chitinase